jgi:hypothetical protein
MAQVVIIAVAVATLSPLVWGEVRGIIDHSSPQLHQRP